MGRIPAQAPFTMKGRILIINDYLFTCFQPPQLF